MNPWQVFWQPIAERQLTTIYLQTDDKKAITMAANRLDMALRVDPLTVGESRTDITRIAFELPLRITFDVHRDDRKVLVLSVRYFTKR